MNAGEKNGKRGSSLGVCTIVVASALIGYMLSIGPVIGLLERGYIGNAAVPYLQRFYAPLQFLQDHSTVAARCFDWYCRFFVPEQPQR